MITPYIRSSSLGTLKMCETQYFISYVLGIEQNTNQKAEMGTIFHKVMECLALCKKREQDNKNEIIKDDAIGDIVIDFDYNTEDGVKEIFDRVFAYYSERSSHQYTKKQEKEIWDWVLNTLSYMDGLYDPRKKNIYQAEQRFDIEINKPWAKYHYELNGEEFVGNLRIKGTVDLILEANSSTLEVCDYKTGQRKDWATGKVKEYKDLCKDVQLMLYYYALTKLYPDKNIMFTINFVRDGGPFTLCFGEEDIIKMEEYLKEKIEHIWKTTEPKMLSKYQTDFRCTRLCSYYKNNWPGKDVNICRYVQNHIKEHGIQNTTEQLMNPSFNPNVYRAPGE